MWVSMREGRGRDHENEEGEEGCNIERTVRLCADSMNRQKQELEIFLTAKGHSPDQKSLVHPVAW